MALKNIVKFSKKEYTNKSYVYLDLLYYEKGVIMFRTKPFVMIKFSCLAFSRESIFLSALFLKEERGKNIKRETNDCLQELHVT